MHILSIKTKPLFGPHTCFCILTVLAFWMIKEGRLNMFCNFFADAHFFQDLSDRVAQLQDSLDTLRKESESRILKLQMENDEASR